jgi:hypothetical protein
LLPAFSYKYVRAPLFIIEAQSDEVVLMYHDSVPYLHYTNDLTPPIKAYMAEFAVGDHAFAAFPILPPPSFCWGSV